MKIVSTAKIMIRIEIITKTIKKNVIYIIFPFSFSLLYFSLTLLSLPHTLLSRDDSTFNIEYDDGDKEFRVPASRMRMLVEKVKEKEKPQVRTIIKFVSY